MKRGIIGIYLIQNSDNGKKYIGQSVDVEYRVCNHFSNLRHNRHGNEHMQRAYNQNPDAFSWVLLKECSIEELDQLEVFYIEQFDSTNPQKGYNCSYGGQQSHKATTETRQKMSNSKKGKKFTPEHCKKIGEANKRRRLSAETKAKIAEKHGKPILQFTTEGIFIARYPNAVEAAKVVGLKNSSPIKSAACGRTKTSAGYVWKHE